VLAAVRERMPVTEDAVRSGLASVRWPGRLEVVTRRPLVVLDGAHNPDGVLALCHELPRLIEGRRLHLLFAVMADKDWRPMVERLAPLCASAVVTRVMPPRGQAAEPVAELFHRWCPATVEPDPARAWHAVRARAAADEAILVAGSLFLIGVVDPLCRPPLPPRPPSIHP
jgi:dihydrofolate synthase/folylpolyglutamate synthase